MLSAIAILRYTLTRLNDDENLTIKNIKRVYIPTGALLLAMKACQSYLRSKQHYDIEEEQKLNVRELLFMSGKFTCQCPLKFAILKK